MHQFPKSICILLGLVGAAAYVVVAIIDIAYGEMSALTAEGKAFQPLTLAIVSFAGFVFVSTCGALIRTGHYIFSFFALCISLFCMAYSGLNGVGFFAGESIGKTRMVEAKAKANKDAVDLANTEAAKLRKETFGWLTGTQVRGKERERLEDKVIALATAPVAVKQADPQIQLPDARADVMRRLFSVQVEDAQLANAGWLVGLLLIIKLAGPSLAFALWPGPKVGDQLQIGTRGFPERNGVIWRNNSNYNSKEDALAELRVLALDKTKLLTVAVLAEHWGLTIEGARRRLLDWQAKRLVVLGRIGKQIYVKSIPPQLVAQNQVKTVA